MMKAAEDFSMEPGNYWIGLEGSSCNYWTGTFKAVIQVSARLPGCSPGRGFSVLSARRFGGIVASELATGPKGRGLEPDKGDGFLRAIKIRSTPSFGCEVKREGPMS
jgi:hypothetical protein